MAAAGLTAFALEAAPRTTRAQSMDVLSSQANIAGYKAVLMAANTYQRFMPMLMTAAGTVKAARMLIMGAGVAGLQAIATAKRLGAVIEASDVRPAVKEQIESLGAKFLDVPFITDEEKEIAQGIGGYARPMPADWMRRKTVIKHGVHIIGEGNLAALVAADASALYARNVLDFLKLIVDAEGKLVINREDDIVAATFHTIINLIIFVLAIYVGYHVVWTVTPALHTPLMAVTNAISAIIIIGAMLAAGLTEGPVGRIAGTLAVALAAVNVFAHAGDVQEKRT
eukprot:gene20391-21005_t